MDKTMLKQFFFGYLEIQKEIDGFLRPQRFSAGIREFCKSEGYGRCDCSAGLILRADNCNRIRFAYRVYDKTGEVSCDILYRNSQRMEHMVLPWYEGIAEFDGQGESVEIYFGYQNMFGFKDIIIDGVPTPKRDKAILCYGDSILQGYCCQFSADNLSGVLGRAFDANVYNFGIGGHYANRRILEDLDRLPEPWMIFFTYGTNEWNYEVDSKEDIQFMFAEFYKRYPKVPVFVLLPLPRRTEKGVKNYGTLEDFRQWITSAAGQYDNFHVLNSGKGLDIPTQMVQDGIHPNNDGMHALIAYVLQDMKRIGGSYV